jgi:transcriptional regulator with XRE-family HTH domain
MQGRGVGDRPGQTVAGEYGDHSESFGAILQRLRDEAGLTQEELASRAGLTAKAVSALERGERRRPYFHTVRSLSDALALTGAERASLAAAVPGRGEAVRTPTRGRRPRPCRRRRPRLWDGSGTSRPWSASSATRRAG